MAEITYTEICETLQGPEPTMVDARMKLHEMVLAGKVSREVFDFIKDVAKNAYDAGVDAGLLASEDNEE